MGRWGLLVWLVGGFTLEALHIFKSPAYLEDPLRRLLWTLAHAHGALLAAVALLLVLVARHLRLTAAAARRVDLELAWGAVLVPAGFLLGGAWHAEADPGPAVILVPLGAVLIAAALFELARAPRRPDDSAPPPG